MLFCLQITRRTSFNSNNERRTFRNHDHHCPAAYRVRGGDGDKVAARPVHHRARGRRHHYHPHALPAPGSHFSRIDSAHLSTSAHL